MCACVSPAAFREYVASAKVKASVKDVATTKLSKKIPAVDGDMTCVRRDKTKQR